MGESYGLICYAPRVEGTLFAVIEKRHSYSNITFFTTFARNFATLRLRNPHEINAKIFHLMSSMMKSEKENIMNLAKTLVSVNSENAQMEIYDKFIAEFGPSQKKELKRKTIDMIIHIYKYGTIIDAEILMQRNTIEMDIRDDNNAVISSTEYITRENREDTHENRQGRLTNTEDVRQGRLSNTEDVRQVHLTFKYLCENTESSQPIWEFPKGHRLNGESGHCCAIREFKEETHIHRNKNIIYHNSNGDRSDLIESIHGTNGRMYTYVYYTATYIGRYLRTCSFTNTQNKEVSRVSWKTRKELAALWENKFPERVKLLDIVIRNILR